MFPEVRDAIATLIDPAALRWISWSHFEVDGYGARNEWLAAALGGDGIENRQSCGRRQRPPLEVAVGAARRLMALSFTSA